MKHLIVIPAYNEQENIERVIQSLVRQSEMPDLLVIVDDGSTDKTAEIVSGLQKNHPWITLVTNKNKDPRATGAKIVRAFKLGLNSINLSDFDLVSKFDADLEFEDNYLHVIDRHFFANPKLGLMGGVCQIMENGKWVDEKVSKSDHVRGALKTYRTEAYKQINGLPEFMGWDSGDEFLLRYHGWEVQAHDGLKVKHYRETNQINGWIKTARLNAKVYHNLRYGFFIGTMSALKRGLSNKPYLISGLLCAKFYWAQFFARHDKRLPAEVGKFVRQYRRKTMRKK